MATAKITSHVTTAPATTEKRSTAKLDTIREIEQQMQQIWADLKVFEVDAPSQPTDK
jgi:leucyl-tRNA synthetase